MSAPMTLLPYQSRWTSDPAGLVAIEKSRRIGISWTAGYKAVMHAGEGLGDVYYQSYSLEMARGFIDDAADWGRRLQAGVESVGETLLDLGKNESVQAFRVHLSSGKQVLAMTSAPRAFRSKGRPGDLGIVDEAAFVDDLEEVLKAALAFRVWGGKVRIISTHNGESSPFAALVRDIREGIRPGTVHTVTLRDALAEGLYRRICEVTGQPWSLEAEAEWELALRAEYGANAAEELDCIPSAGSGAWLAWALIRAAENEAAGNPELYGGGPAFIGVDVARRRNLWVASVVEDTGPGLWVREMVVKQGITFAEQYQIVADLADRYRVVRIAVDQGGMGEAVVEELQRQHGSSRVEGVLLQGARRLDVASALREPLEDRTLWLPAGDQDLRDDLHAVRAESGRTGATRLVADDAGVKGHADRFWSLALACAAAADTSTGPPEYETVQERDTTAGLDEWLNAGAAPGLFRGYL